MSQDDVIDPDEPLPHYDFTDAVQGKYCDRLPKRAEKQLIELDKDVQEVFYDSESVNEALRLLIKIGREQVAPKHIATKS